MSQRDSTWLLQQVAAGDSNAERELFARYADRLTGLATKRLPTATAQIDAEDVTQSALACFFAEAKAGRWQHDRPGDLWRLLAGIVLNKCRAHTRRQLAAKRDLRRRHRGANLDALKSELVGDLSTPSQQVLMWEAASEIFRGFDVEEVRLVQLKLSHLPIAEIARQLGCSARTARRKLAELEEKLQARLTQSVSHFAKPDPAISSNVAFAEELAQL